MNRRRVLIAVAGCLLLLAAGCAPTVTPTVKPVLPTLSVTELTERLDAASQRFFSVRGEARVKMASAGQNLTVSQVLLAQRPDRLRSEAMSPFGLPMMIMVADGRDLSVYLPTQGAFYRGEATVANVARFTRLPFRLDDLVGLLLYSVPRFPFQDSTVAMTETGYLLELTGGEGVVQRFGFDADGRLNQAAYLIDGQLRMQVDYADFDPAQQDFPRSLQLAVPDREVAVSIAFSADTASNVELPRERFVLNPPPGVEPQPLP